MGCQAGCIRLQQAVLNHWPTETYNAGCYNPASALDDGHTPSAHAKGEAIDIGIHVPYRGTQSVGQKIFLWLHAKRFALGIVQLIYEQQIWSAYNQPERIRSYTVNPHHDHIHCQLITSAARNAGLIIPAFPENASTPPTPPSPPPPPPSAIDNDEESIVRTFFFNGTFHSVWLDDVGHVLHQARGDTVREVLHNVVKVNGQPVSELFDTNEPLSVLVSPDGKQITVRGLKAGNRRRMLAFDFMGSWTFGAVNIP